MLEKASHLFRLELILQLGSDSAEQPQPPSPWCTLIRWNFNCVTTQIGSTRGSIYYISTFSSLYFSTHPNTLKIPPPPSPKKLFFG